METVRRSSAGLDHRTDAPRDIAYWLLGLAGMVFVMVILGGVTRLTDSGLSIVDWRPVTGWLPPQTDADWAALFEQYKQFPEFRERNADITLGGFKSIFWIEFIHRGWGRLIGIVFLLPFVFYSMRGWIRWPLLLRLGVVFLLGAGQGALGWFMVQSGLVDRPEVSQYRLVAHLALALVIYGYLLWLAFRYFSPPGENSARAGVKLAAVAIVIWTFITMLSGGFVAGLDAGLTYNTFPLMDGRLIPDGLFLQPVWYLNFFENVTTVQFDHRVLAELLVIFVLAFWYFARRRLDGKARIALHGLAVVVLLQLSLGIATLLFVVPITLAAAHQAGALLVLSFAIWILYEAGFATRRG